MIGGCDSCIHRVFVLIKKERQEKEKKKTGNKIVKGEHRTTEEPDGRRKSG